MKLVDEHLRESIKHQLMRGAALCGVAAGDQLRRVDLAVGEADRDPSAAFDDGRHVEVGRGAPYLLAAHAAVPVVAGRLPTLALSR